MNYYTNAFYAGIKSYQETFSKLLQSRLDINSSYTLLAGDLPDLSRTLQPPPMLDDTWTELLIKTLSYTAARARPPLLLTHNPAGVALGGLMTNMSPA